MYVPIENMAAMSGLAAFAGVAVLLHAAYSAVECTRRGAQLSPRGLLAGHRRAGLVRRARAPARKRKSLIIGSGLYGARGGADRAFLAVLERPMGQLPADVRDIGREMEIVGGMERRHRRETRL